MASLTSTLTLKLLDDVSKPARSIAQALGDAEGKFKAVAKGMANTGATDKFIESLSKLKVSKKDIDAVATAWKDYTTASKLAADSSQWTEAQAAGVAKWERQTVASIRAVTSERQREMALERQATQRMKAEYEKRAAERREWLRGERSMVGVLGAGAIGGVMVEGTKKAIESGAELEQLKFRIREASRNNPSEEPMAEGLARELAARYPMLTQGKVLDSYLELRPNALGGDGMVDAEKASRNLRVVSRAQAAGVALGYDITPVDAQNLMKAVESSGRAGDPDALSKMFDSYLKGKQMYGTALTSEGIRDYVMNAKGANFSIGDDAFYRQTITRVSEGNASRLGNEVNQTMTTLVGGTMKLATAKWLAQVGLIKPGQIVNTKGGNVKIKGGLLEQALLGTDQMAWSHKVLMPLLEKGGYLSESKIKARMDLQRSQELAAHPNAKINEAFLRERSEDALLAEIVSQSGARSTVTDNLLHLLANFALISRDSKGMDYNSGTDAADRVGENPVAAFAELTSALSNFGAVLSNPIMATAGQIMNSMAQGIASLSTTVGEFQKAHPELAKALTGAGIVAGGVGGTALTFGALGGLMNGFGLKSSATALDLAARDLSAAAGHLAGGGPGGIGPGGGPNKSSGLGWPRWIASISSVVATALAVADQPAVGSQDAADAANTNNSYWDNLMKKWLPAGWVGDAPKEYSIVDGGKFGRGLPSAYAPSRQLPSQVDQLVNKDYGDRRNLFNSNPEQVRENTRGASLSALPEKAAEAKAALELINTVEIKPSGDLSWLDAAISKAQQLRATLQGLDAGAGASPVPSLGKAMRGNFTSSGIGHE